MANNAEADERSWVAEQYHLERIQMVKNYPLFKTLPAYNHSAYKEFGEFMQRRASWTVLQAKSAATTLVTGMKRLNPDVLYEDAQYFTSRARQALELAVEINPYEHKSVLLLTSILLESEEYEKAYQLITSLMNKLLNQADRAIFSFNMDEFDGYHTDDLVNNQTVIDPMCWVILAIIFKIRGNALGARKAILMANKLVNIV